MIEANPPSSRRHLRYLIAAILFGAVAAGAYFLLHPKADTGKDGPAYSSSAFGQHGRGGKGGDRVTPVSVATVTKGDIDITRRALGTVTSLATVTVRTQVSGQLMEIGFQEGQMVHKGDFLAQIDPRPFENALKQAEGALQKDQALLKDAQLNLDRFKKLWAQNSIAKQQVDTQAALVEQDAGNVLTDQSQIDAAKLNLTYARITAPVTGRVGLRQVDAGNFVQTSDANGIVVITQLQPITALFTLPEDDVPTLMKLYHAGSDLVATAYDRAQSMQLAVGKVVSTDNQIDSTTGTVKLRAQFDNADNALFPNQFVNIDLKLSTDHDVLLLPQAAIQHGTPGTFVYKLKPDNTVTIQIVKLGTSQGDKVAVTEGLAEGDQTVTEGVDKLREGARVSVK